MARRGKTTLAHASLAWMACFWHTPPRKEGHAMTDGQKDAWAGVLLTALMVGILLGGLLVLRLTGN
jgi:hypothetical protein